MAKIERISPAQAARFGEFARHWVEIGLSTEPADFDLATDAALRAYKFCNLSRPMVILRMGSPYAATLGGAIAWAMLRELAKNGGQQVWSLVWSQVGSQVRSQVESQVRSQVWSGVSNDRGGALWASWCAHIAFMRDVLGWSDPVLERHQIDEDLAKSCGWVWWHENVLAISDRPSVVNRDDRGRLHCETGPSIAYRDGWALHHWHGVAVPADVIERPASITVARIRAEENAEVRRCMIERYGYDRYCADAGLQIVDQCPADHPMIGLRTARLWRDGDLCLVDLLNSTPESDGTVRRYVIPVDPNAYDGRASRECLAAAASTWRKRSDTTQLFYRRPEDYACIAES